MSPRFGSEAAAGVITPAGGGGALIGQRTAKRGWLFVCRRRHGDVKWPKERGLHHRFVVCVVYAVPIYNLLVTLCCELEEFFQIKTYISMSQSRDGAPIPASPLPNPQTSTARSVLCRSGPFEDKLAVPVADRFTSAMGTEV